MGFKRIGDIPGWNQKVCRHPEHNMPMHVDLEPGGMYEYECPGCGRKMSFHVEEHGLVTNLRPRPVPTGLTHAKTWAPTT